MLSKNIYIVPEGVSGCLKKAGVVSMEVSAAKLTELARVFEQKGINFLRVKSILDERDNFKPQAKVLDSLYVGVVVGAPITFLKIFADAVFNLGQASLTLALSLVVFSALYYLVGNIINPEYKTTQNHSNYNKALDLICENIKEYNLMEVSKKFVIKRIIKSAFSKLEKEDQVKIYNDFLQRLR